MNAPTDRILRIEFPEPGQDRIREIVQVRVPSLPPFPGALRALRQMIKSTVKDMNLSFSITSNVTRQ